MMIERLKEIFLEIIGIDGLSCNEKEMSEYIKSFLSENNYEFFEDNSHQQSNSNTGNIICKVGTGGEFILTAHMDTARSTSKVNPVLKNDRIVSDGTTVLGVDNRAGIAILLCLLEKIKKENISTKDFLVGFTTCEETTLAGSKNFMLNGSTKFCFVFDSYLQPGHFINESYGAASFNLQIKGKAAHSGIEPESGINSLKIAAEAISKLKLGLYNNETTLNIGKISGGSSINVVPDLIKMDGEIRSTSTKKIEKCFSDVINIFNETANLHKGIVEFDLNWDFQPYYLDEKSRIVQKITNAIRAVGLTPSPALSKGGSDANSFNARGIQAVNIGIGAQNPHSNDEFILYEDFNNAFKLALELVVKK